MGCLSSLKGVELKDCRDNLLSKMQTDGNDNVNKESKISALPPDDVQCVVHPELWKQKDFMGHMKCLCSNSNDVWEINAVCIQEVAKYLAETRCTGSGFAGSHVNIFNVSPEILRKYNNWKEYKCTSSQ